MLTELATDFRVTPAAAGIVATVVPIGYALGVFLFVPLAGKVHPRRQFTLQSTALVAGLILTAFMPTLIATALSFALVGILANIGQVLIPVASRLVPSGRRGAMAGTMGGAVIVGIFGGRILSSVLVGSVGWRWVVVAFAGLVLLTVPFVRRVLNIEYTPPQSSKTYGSLLIGTFAMVKRSPELLESTGIQFGVFATFNTSWTVVVLHLTAEPQHWSVFQAGLIGIVGLAAGIVAPCSGWFVDRYGTLWTIGFGLGMLAFASLLALLGAMMISALALSLFVITLGSQTIQTANQTRILAANSDNAAQANTMFMVGVFLGGSVGAVLGPYAYQRGGLHLVAAASGALVILSAAAWIAASWRQKRRGEGAPRR